MKNLYLFIIGILILCVCCEQKTDSETSSVMVTEDGDVIYQRPPVNRRPDGPPEYQKNGMRIHTNDLGILEEVFNDSNYRQYAYAEKLGIQPLNTLRDAYNTTKPLVKIKTNENYFLQELTHSMPYLVPQAAWLLDDIGMAFIDSLKNRGGEGYQIVVTSALRSPLQVKQLQKVNVNATDSSTHKFGTTFDIAYNAFYATEGANSVSSNDMKQTLAEVLYDMRKQGRCLVKYEKKTPCFHITVTK